VVVRTGAKQSGRERLEAARDAGELDPNLDLTATAVLLLIEVPHDPERVACARVVDVFQKSGSHWVTHADWGCRDLP